MHNRFGYVGRKMIEPNELQRRGKTIKIFDIRKNPDDRQIPGSTRAEGSALEGGYKAWVDAGLPTEERSG